MRRKCLIEESHLCQKMCGQHIGLMSNMVKIMLVQSFTNSFTRKKHIYTLDVVGSNRGQRTKLVKIMFVQTLTHSFARKNEESHPFFLFLEFNLMMSFQQQISSVRLFLNGDVLLSVYQMVLGITV